MRVRLAVPVLALVAQAALAGPQAGNPSPWPVPAEREAFQRMELERKARWFDVAKRPATKKSQMQDRYDVTYYRLYVDVRNVAAERLRGDVVVRFRVTQGPLDSLYFDLGTGMAIESVTFNGEPAAATHPGYSLLVKAPEPMATGDTASVRIFYGGHPNEIGWGPFGWNSHAGHPLLWTLSEPDGAREWWPCKDRPDDKADSIDVFIRAPMGILATSNGLLVGTDNETDGSRTFHWKHTYPITTYLVSVTATNYDRIEDHYVYAPGDTMLIEHFVYPETRSLAEIDYSITPEAIGLLADKFGPYPFLREKYGHSFFPWGGGMEHQTNTSYGAALVTGLNHYDYLLVHELAHQWWGDMTSPADWRDVWLNEGFATYAEALWYEHRNGAEGYRTFMNVFARVEDPSGPLYDPLELFDQNLTYNKGGWVVHMLRGVLGDSVFFAALSEYRARTEYRSTTTAELQEIIEEVSGRSMDFFFQPWIYGVNRPRYAVSFLGLGEPGLPSVAIHLDQTQAEPAFFEMPVDLQVELEGGGTVRTRIWNDPDHADVELDLPAAAAGVTVDPDSWILKAVQTAAYTMHITTDDLPPGQADSLYEAAIRGRGGVPPYQWSVADALPEGIALDPLTGTLSGTAPDSGSYAFSIRLTDDEGATDTQAYRWLVGAVPPDTGSVHPTGVLGLKLVPSPVRRWANFTIDGPSGDRFVLSVYDLQGRLIRTVWDGPLPPRAISWNGEDESGNDVASGVYLARLTSRSGTINKRVVWVR